MDSEKEIIKILKKETRLEEIKLEIPPSPEMGDYAFPCFELAKKLRKSPNEVAQELCKKLSSKKFIKKVEVKGPYLNFFIEKSDLIKKTLAEISKKKEKYGSLDLKNKKALIEHTSINPNASPHVGRARNAIIGDSLVKLFKFNGYKTEVHYYINDVGKQIAMLVLAGKGKKLNFNSLLKTYIDINKKIEKNPKLEKEVFDLLNRLEKGDKKVRKQFKDVVEICIKGQMQIFSELGVKYDLFDYESKYLWNKETEKILKQLEKTKKLFVDEEGRYVLNQEGYGLAMKTPVLVLTRADKTSLYGLRDIAYNIEKNKRAKDENLVVLGEDQKLYFQQIKAALDLLKIPVPGVVHYSFVLLKTGKMSTRKGNLVLLEDFMKEAVEKAEKEIKKKKKAKLTKELGKTIGYGALKYSIIKVSPEKNVVFDWNQALSFEGETGPYVQYAHARICSILGKHGKKVDANIKFDLLKEPEEIGIIKKLAEFPKVVEKTQKELKPHLIASYVYDLARKFNDFYEKCPVLSENEELKKARLVLVSCIKQILETGLDLLGINAPVKM